MKLKHFLNLLTASTVLASQEPQQILQKPLWDTTAAPQVTLPQGRIVGTVTQREDFPQTVDAFLGIPYAEPPTGPIGRFFPARPVGNSSEVYDATKWGAKCPGKVFVDIGPPLDQNEDCLTVNLFRGSGAADGGKKLPVAIWVHGGAFNRGTGKFWFQWRSDLAVLLRVLVFKVLGFFGVVLCVFDINSRIIDHFRSTWSFEEH